jgi:hypothetical protein
METVHITVVETVSTKYEKLIDEFINREPNDPGCSRRPSKGYNPDSYPIGVTEQDKGSLSKMFWTLFSDALPLLPGLW